jgi:hypothetical protein
MYKENLKKHVSNLCSILNRNNINNVQKAHFIKDGKIHTWECDNYPEDVFGGEIACDSHAFNFLKRNGHIDIGVCWDCGKEPIDDSYLFTDGHDPSIKYYICRSCYGGGKKQQKDFGIKKEGTDSKCYIATMCYGDINAPQVKVLRKYRDEILVKKLTGRIFVRLYYKISPSFVRIMRNNTRINRLIRRAILDRIVNNIK